MKTSEYIQYDAVGLAELIKKKEITPREACDAALEVYAATEPTISATVESWPEDADGQIAEADKNAPFYGVPFFIKDILLTMKGKKCEDCSLIGEGYTATEDSALMKRFRKSGVITLGRTKTPEFGFSTTTEPNYPGPARNPWNTDYSTGGSSGGAGGVVSARVVPVAHASDGGGSIRVPAAACGLVGLKPSRGRISAGYANDEPLFGMATEFIVSRTVRDTAQMLDLCHGAEPGDPFVIQTPEKPYMEAAKQPVGKLKIGYMPHSMGTIPNDPEVLAAVERSAQLCADLGHIVEDVTPNFGLDWETFMHMEAVLWCTGIYSWVTALGGATGRPANEKYLQPETLACYIYGKEQTADTITTALAQKNTVTRAFLKHFEQYDVLLSPVMPTNNYRIGTYTENWGKTGLDWTARVFNLAPFTPVYNVTGLPAISLPLEHDQKTDLPIGIHFGAGFGKEDLLLRLASQLEIAKPWIKRMPKITQALA